MNLLSKSVNHMSWILNAIKEQNRLLQQEIQMRMSDKVFLVNRNFQKYYYSFNTYQKLENNVEKGFKIMISSLPIKKQGLISLRNTYLNRSAFHFKEAGNYLKLARSELLLPGNIFESMYRKMKVLASLLSKFEMQLDFLIKNF